MDQVDPLGDAYIPVQAGPGHYILIGMRGHTYVPGTQFSQREVVWPAVRELTFTSENKPLVRMLSIADGLATAPHAQSAILDACHLMVREIEETLAAGPGSFDGDYLQCCADFARDLAAFERDPIEPPTGTDWTPDVEF